MRVFVTGASGWIGAAVVSELLQAGHSVVGLARSDQAAQSIEAMGGSITMGGLDDHDALQAAATAADGVIHLAFGHDFAVFEESIAQEGRVVQAFGKALAGTGKPFVMASGTPFVPGRASTEDDGGLVDGPAGGRARNARAAMKLAATDVRASVVRLPRSVHSSLGRYGFASMLIAAAQRSGVAGYVGDGTQRWPAVHVLDAARLFRLALEQAPAGTVLHAVRDEGDAMRSIVEVIGDRLKLPVQPVPAEQFGVLGMIFGLDQPSSSAQTRRRFNWNPEQPRLLEDLRLGRYPES